MDIPDDRRIHLDLTLPADFPVGKAEMRITVTPSSESKTDRKAFESLAGCLKGSGVFEGDAVAIQRAMRAEWDRPWDCDEEDGNGR